MSKYSAKIRACMIRSFSQVLKPVRKVMDLSIKTISEQSGIPEDVLMNIENGKEQLSESNYVALAAVFDNFMSQRVLIENKILQKILETDYADPTIPAHYAEHFKKIEGKPLLYKWFAAFKEPLFQLHKAPNEIFTDEDLKLLVENYKIFIDETVLEDEDFPLFMARIAPFLKNASDVTGSNVYVRITKDVITKLKETAQTSSDDLDALKRATEAIMKYKSESLLDIFDAENIEAVFDEYRDRFQFMLITDNRYLAIKINSSQKESRISPILFASIYEDGNIALYDFDSAEQDDTPESSYDDYDDEEAEEDDENFAQEDVLRNFIERIKGSGYGDNE